MTTPPTPNPFFQLLALGALPSFPLGGGLALYRAQEHLLDRPSISNGHILPRTALPSEDAEAFGSPERLRRVETRREGVLIIYSRTPSPTGKVIEMRKEEAERPGREARAQNAQELCLPTCSTATCYG